ncbi:MAG: ABC-2 transporter permease [archaeon]|nr:ABC-2 transporter permease [archaeon]
MNALLYKDFVSIKFTLVVMLIMASLFSMWMGQGGPLSFFIGPAIASTVVGTSLNLDEKAGWLKFAVSSGTSRKTIIFNKLKLALVVTLIGILSGFVGVAISSIDTEISLELLDVLFVVIFGFTFGLFTSCVMIFACYKFDAGYSGLFAAIIIGACAGLMVGANDLLTGVLTDLTWMFPILSVIFACLGTVFFIAGMKVLNNKDL